MYSMFEFRLGFKLFDKISFWDTPLSLSHFFLTIPIWPYFSVTTVLKQIKKILSKSGTFDQAGVKPDFYLINSTAESWV